MTLQLKQFDMKQIAISNNSYQNTANIIILDDETHADKTYLVADILSHKKIPIGCAILGNNTEPNNYSKLMSSSCIHNEFNSNIIQNIIRRQRRMITKSNVDGRAFLILDNCLTKSIIAPDDFKDIFMNYYGYQTTLISIIQYPFQISPIIRNSCFDHIFILKNNNYSAKNIFLRI